MTAPAVGGIFVGGSSTRMGGRPKGLLVGPDGATLVERTRAVLTNAGVADVVLVGAQPAYAHLGIERIEDEPPSIGPLGGLVAFLRRAYERSARHAIVVACDMPHVSTRLVGRLLAAPPASAVAPRREGRWEPLCARYDAAAILPIAEARVRAGEHALQGLLDCAGAAELPAGEGGEDDPRELRDWDTPADVVRDA